MSRTANSIKMVLASTLCQIVIFTCGLILPPLFISQYGSEVNGLLNLVKQLMSYFGIVCLGLGVSAQVALYKPIANNNWKEINSILSAARYFYNVSGIIFAVLVFVSSAILPFIISSTVPVFDIMLIVLITGIGSICEYVIISKYRIFLSANQKQYINSRITAEGILLNTIVSVILIKCDFNIIVIQLGSSVIYVLRLLYTIKYVKKNYPLISFNAERPALEKLENRWSAFFYQISRMIINLSPMIIVSIVGSLNDASIFSVYFMVFSSLTMISGIFSSGIQAPFGSIIANNEIAVLKNAFASFEFLYTLILSICFCCGILLMTSFVGSYIHNNDGINYILPSFSFFMCVYFFIFNYRIPFTTLVEAKGLFKLNNKYNLIESIVFVLFSIFMVKRLGLLGIAISGIVTSLPRTIHYIVYCKQYFGSAINLFKTFSKFCITIVVSFILYFSFEPVSNENVMKWLFCAIPYVLICVVTITFFHIIADFNSFLTVYKRILKKNKVVDLN